MRATISKLDAGHRIDDAAPALGHDHAAAGAVSYLDARDAAARLAAVTRRAASASTPPRTRGRRGDRGAGAPTRRAPTPGARAAAHPGAGRDRRRDDAASRARAAPAPATRRPAPAADAGAATQTQTPQPRRRRRSRRPAASSPPPRRRRAAGGDRRRPAGRRSRGAARAPHRPPLRRVPRPAALAGAARRLARRRQRAASLASAATSQQVADVSRPRARGSIIDRNGHRLAVSEPADDVSATPVPRQGPASRPPRSSRRCSADAEASWSSKLARRDTGFVYLARQLPAAQARQVPKLELAGITLTPGQPRIYPRELARRAAARRGRHRRQRPVGPRVRAQQDACRDRRRAARSSRTRSPADRVRDDEAGEARRRRRADASTPRSRTMSRRSSSGVGTDLPPEGRHGDRHGPARRARSSRWPTGRASTPTTRAARPPYAAQNRAVGYDLRAGLDVQGLHGRRRARGRRGHARHEFNLPPQIQVADRVIGESHAARQGDARHRARSSRSPATSARSRSASASTAERFDQWVRRFGFGTPTGVDLPGEEHGLVLPYDKYSGSSMGNLPIGQGEPVTPMQMAAAYAAIANGGSCAPQIVGDRRQARRRCRAASASSRPQSRRGAHDARGRRAEALPCPTAPVPSDGDAGGWARSLACAASRAAATRSASSRL